MLWIVLVTALGLLLGALIVTYGYRHSTLIVLAVLAAIVAALVWYIRYDDREGTGLIGAGEMELQKLEMTKLYRNSYRMTARLLNKSMEYTLTSVEIVITASDCMDEYSDCIVVGEDQRSIPVDIPPGQARDILEQYVLPRFVLQGELKWSYRIPEIKAERR
ncbi:MAG: hypothetical protein MAG794_01100 [Gammaproteobacteria bacterium]|nr:hypothetical protein [Gammaproteobacteria bacterium]